VEPFASLVTLPRLRVPRLLLNRELVGPFKHRLKRRTDVAVTGDLVVSVKELARLAGWECELRALQEAAESGACKGKDSTGEPRDGCNETADPKERSCRGDTVPTRTAMRSGTSELEVGMSKLSLCDKKEEESGSGTVKEGGVVGSDCARVKVGEDMAPSDGITGVSRSDTNTNDDFNTNDADS